MKLNKSLLFLNIFLLVIVQGLKAQPGCPSVEAGNNVTLDCGTNCTNLSASCLATGATTTYTASSIPYAPPYAYNTGTPILVNIDDTWSSAITLPFTFCFYGTSYTQIIAGSNGNVSFAIADAGTFCEWSYSASCPSPDLIPAGNIFGPYHDIDPSVTGQMYYAILGSYPCRTYVVSWNQIAMFSSSCNSLLATHQIVLYESTNVIEVYIQNKPLCTSWNGGNAIVGIQNPDGTIGITAPGRNTSQWTASNEAWRFTPAGSPNYTLTWWQGATQIGTGATVNVCPSAATTYTAQVIYDCCVGNDVTVTDDVTVSLASGGVSLTPTNPAICGNGSVNLTASGSDTYTWSPATGLNQTTGSTVTASPTTTTTYSVTGISPGCTSTNEITVTVNPNPDITNMTTSICSGGNFTISPVDGTNGVVPAGTTYSWPDPGVIGITGTASGSNAVNISGTLTNTTNTPINVVYTVTPEVGSCTGNAFLVTVTVNPVPAITNMAAAICSGGTFTSNPANGTNGIVPTGTTYSWSAPVVAGITGTAAGNNVSNIDGTLINSTNAPIDVVYNVTPSAGTCDGAPFTVTITVNPVPTSDFTISSPNCTGNMAEVTYNGTGTSGATYNWDFSGGNAVPGSGQGPHQVTWSTPGSYNITLTVTEYSCASTQTIHTALVSNISTNSHTSTDVICNGQNSGTATVYPVDGSAPYSYVWNTVPAQTTQTATNLPAGTFYVTITDNVGCVTYDTVQIIQPSALDIDVTYENEGCLNSCDGSVSVNVTGGIQPYDYSWTGAVSNTSEIQNLCAGNYSVTVSDSNNCTLTGSATIITNSPINADAYADAQTVLMPASVQFNFTGSGAVDYLWDFGDGTTSNISNPSHVYTSAGEYTVILVVSSGAPDFCTDSIQIIITVVEPSMVTIPNIFTPNVDGVNETFRAESEGLETEEMLIYNRWGKQIYSWSEVGGEWDGTINGQKAAEGIYYYIFGAVGFDGKDYRFNGTVTLLR